MTAALFPVEAFTEFALQGLLNTFYKYFIIKSATHIGKLWTRVQSGFIGAAVPWTSWQPHQNSGRLRNVSRVETFFVVEAQLKVKEE